MRAWCLPRRGGRQSGTHPSAPGAAVTDRYTADQITAGIAEAVKARDFPAVVSLLKMLAVRDPRQAEVVYESMLAVLDGSSGE